MNANQVYGVLRKYVEDTLAGTGALKGEKGDKGDTGAKGENATITVGIVTSGPTSSVTNSGTSTNAVLDFVLEKGDKGDKGEQGEQGLPGVDGVSVTVVEHGANDATTYRLEITDKDGTIITQNLIGRGCQWLEGTELTSTQEYTVLEIANSFDGDYYLNKDTCYVYRRIDDDITTNKWYYVGTLQGIEGKDAYEVAVEEGFVGTRAEWLASLVGRVELIEKVWQKPDLLADTTELDTWYYYKISNPDNILFPGMTTDNAWLSNVEIDRTVNYPQGNYGFYGGSYYYCVTTIGDTPAITENSTYYMIFDEQNMALSLYLHDLESDEVTLLGVLDVTRHMSAPDGYTIVPATIKQCGTWQQTVYVGNSKDTATDVTLDTGASVSGFITIDTLNELIGDEALKTVSQAIKGAINEHEALLRGSDNSKVLNTKEKDVFGAINEIFSRNYANVAKCEETSIRAFCDKYVAEKGTEAELTSYFFYSMGIATDVPEGNNGWGYCHCIITQDPRYKILIYYAPDLRKVFMTYDGDTGWSNEWTSNLTNEDIATVLDDTVTNKQIVGALTLKENLGLRHIANYTDNESEGLDFNNFLDEGIYTFGITNPILNSPAEATMTYGSLKVIKYTNAKGYTFVEQVYDYLPTGIFHVYGRRYVVENDEWSEWGRLSGTTIPDIPKTIYDLDAACVDVYEKCDTGTDNNWYMVKNGVCFIQIDLVCKEENTGYKCIFDSLPIPAFSVAFEIIGVTDVFTGNVYRPMLVSIGSDGKMVAVGGSVGPRYITAFSYPVADDWRP